MLSLQERTIVEAGQAARGRRLPRVAASSLFAEYVAPGLIELFAGRAADLDVELNVHDPRRFGALLHSRAVDPPYQADAGGPVQPRQRVRRGGRQRVDEVVDGGEADRHAVLPEPGRRRDGERRTIDTRRRPGSGCVPGVRGGDG
ncbi:hypothetical protein [Streptosporangium sp. NPDC001681]|uniref:hypothetical protein n=1 Tax=Streptosporangium sp. NPDC001681 TaxID=3154395 RepID=UPI00332F1AEC